MGTAGVRVQATGERFAEITLGRACFQQVRAATCKDSWFKVKTEAVGGFRSGAWARRSDKAGVMPGDTGPNPVLSGGNTCPRAKGLSVQ